MRRFIVVFYFLCLTAYGQIDVIKTERQVRDIIQKSSEAGAAGQTNRSNRSDQEVYGVLLDYSKKMTPHLSMSQLRNGLADTSRVVYVTDTGKSGNFKYDAESSAADDSAMVLVVGKRRYVRDADVLYPRYFGAVGDGKTDDSRALQRCLNYAKSYQTIDFQGLIYQFTKISLAKTDVILRGGGAKLNGTLAIGDGIPKIYNGKISGFYFATNGHAILINGVRKLEISNNTFSNNDRSIYVVEGATKTHVNAMVEINKNIFTDVGYCLYVARTPSSSWMVSSDFTFEGNVANNALITAVYANGIDGLKYINNVIFTPSDPAGRKNKKNHLRIDAESDWVIVANNNFFESGEESLYFVNGKAVNIIGNNFAWSGQKGIFSIISMNGNRKDIMLNVSSNIFDSFSGNVVSIGKDVSGSVGLVGNSINYTNALPRYYGTDTLSKTDHFVVQTGNPNSVINQNNAFLKAPAGNFKGMKIGSYVVNMKQEDATFISSTSSNSIQVDQGKTAAICKLLDENLLINSYGGVITTVVKCSGNTSTYQLMITKAARNSIATVGVISSAGLLEGKNSNHPSFKFSIADDVLIATPIGQTSGKFTFTSKSEGTVVLAEP